MKLIIIFGPPATGKMTVGRSIAEKTGLKLFHNHMTIELLLNFFPFGSPSFGQLTDLFRKELMKAVAKNDPIGLIFTYVWALDHPEDKLFIDSIVEIFRNENAEICFVELYCQIEERLRRNKTELRLLEKPSKRDISTSEIRLLESETKYTMNTQGEFFYDNYLRIDNTHLQPDIVADKIVNYFQIDLLTL
ncbi:MAG: AAA family ATPase [Candidatus Heimdallarchaeota archaeon]|nr:AAA family ATPase [Candidatus Heimdallarchaeota archaeon]MDH5644629.1 AAA family ATPase [Candidatus Heimdallarchaeota archaeon]